MKPLVFYPSKILDRYSFGPYQVQLRQMGRLEHETAELYEVTVTRLYDYEFNQQYGSIKLAVAAFEKLKEIAIINCGCVAFRIAPISFEGFEAQLLPAA